MNKFIANLEGMKKIKNNICFNDCIQKSSSYSEDDIVVKNDAVVKEGVVDINPRENTVESFSDEEDSEVDAVNGEPMKRIIQTYTHYDSFNVDNIALDKNTNNDVLVEKANVGEVMVGEVIKTKACFKEASVDSTNSVRYKADEY